VEGNYHLSKIREEKKKMEAMKDLVVTHSPLPSTLPIPSGTPIDSTTESPCPSPAPSTQSTETIGKKTFLMSVYCQKLLTIRFFNKISVPILTYW
jgi:hypothetical protein